MTRTSPRPTSWASPWSSPASATSCTEGAPMTDPVMMPGAPVADAVFADLEPRIAALVAAGHAPGLGTILVGDDGPSARYVGMKQEKARELGLTAHDQHLPADATQADVEAAIARFNDDPAVAAMIVQHPTPPQIDYEAAIMTIDPDKDADGAHPTN